MCPSGPAIGDQATATDTAHATAVCSNKGDCDYKTGLCVCQTGWTGLSCNQVICANNCNGHGECKSLSEIAMDFDGYRYEYVNIFSISISYHYYHSSNRSTTYNLWDMNINRGCKCDTGYSGHDCSVRECPRGPDPRLSTSNQEVVKFVCTCPAGGCGGKFILRYMGLSTNTVLSPTSTAAQLATALMTAQGLRSSSSN
jgi:hypothetical protein